MSAMMHRMEKLEIHIEAIKHGQIDLKQGQTDLKQGQKHIGEQQEACAEVILDQFALHNPNPTPPAFVPSNVLTVDPPKPQPETKLKQERDHTPTGMFVCLK